MSVDGERAQHDQSQIKIETETPTYSCKVIDDRPVFKDGCKAKVAELDFQIFGKEDYKHVKASASVHTGQAKEVRNR
jgi:predicted NACHT family NTPase